MTAISYQPWATGATDPIWLIPLATDAGADDISNFGTFVLIFQTAQGDVQGTGTITVQSASPAALFYQPSSQDVARPFVGSILIEATNTTTSQKRIWGPISFALTQS